VSGASSQCQIPKRSRAHPHVDPVDEQRQIRRLRIRQVAGSERRTCVGAAAHLPSAGARSERIKAEPGIFRIDVSLRSLTLPTYRENSHANHTWPLHSHATACCIGSDAPSRGSIPIARSTFRCLACPCVVLGRDLAYRPGSTNSDAAVATSRSPDSSTASAMSLGRDWRPHSELHHP